MKGKIYKILYLFIFLLPAFNISAQKITIELPQDSGKEYVFYLNKGLNTDTIQRGNLSFVGGVTINIPDLYKGYCGMATLSVKDGNQLNLVVNNENFSLQVDSDKKNRFKNSKENDYLFAFLQKKTNSHSDTTLYASRFVDLLQYTKQLNNIINQNRASLQEIANARIYGVDKLDVESLYTSGLWFFVIDGLVRLTNDQEQMAADMVKILTRVKSQEVFLALSENLITITSQFGWDDAFDTIVTYIQESGRIPVPQGNIYAAFASVKVKRGQQVPHIEGLESPIGKEKVLLAFYQPDCSNCKIQLNKLIDDYPKLKALGIRVISISAGYNKEEYDKDNSHFPWTENLCDYKGFAGVNFINYGIIGTPTFFLLDEEQKLVRRFAQASDVYKYVD